MLLDDTGGDGGMRKEGRHVKVVVSLDEDSKWPEVKPCGENPFLVIKTYSVSVQLEYSKPQFQLLSQSFRLSCLHRHGFILSCGL